MNDDADPEASLFTLTSNAIYWGHGAEILPLSNLARIGKYNVLDARFPVIWIVVLILTGLALIAIRHIPAVAAGLPLLAAAACGVRDRMKPRRFALGVETCSGSKRYLVSKDEAFIDRVLTLVATYFEREQSAGVRVSFEDRSITVVGAVHGDAQTGDRRHS